MQRGETKIFYCECRNEKQSPSRPRVHQTKESTPGTFTRKLLLLLASSSINHQQIITTMDKFAVIKTLGKGYSSMVDDTFDNVADATAYCNIMRRKADGWNYAVYQLNEEL